MYLHLLSLVINMKLESLNKAALCICFKVSLKMDEIELESSLKNKSLLSAILHNGQ